MSDNTTVGYTVSFYTKRDVPYLLNRPWWKLFGHDSIEWREEWVRIVTPIHDGNYIEQLIEDGKPIIHSLIECLAKTEIYPCGGVSSFVDSGDGPALAQLEQNPRAAKYIETSGCSIVDEKHNLYRNHRDKS